MFTTLLESTPHKRAGGSTAIVSTLFHSVLIAAAVYATTATDAAKVVATAASRVTTIQWVKPAGPPAPPAKPASKPKPKARSVVAPKTVPTATPPIDANAQPTVEPETGATSNLAPGGAPGAYNAFEVDIEVVAIAGSIRPQYPEMLRSSGTEGQVIAQFIVNEKGRVDKESFKLVSSTHPMFTESVKRALPQMRFKPAKIGGKPVSQLVQQLFVFKLDDR